MGKKIILILTAVFSTVFSLLLNAHSCFANETLTINMGSDYLITTENAIISNTVSSPEVLSISPFFTIYNEKNIFLLHPKKVGKTRIIFFLKGKSVTFEVTIKQKNSQKDETITPTSIDKGDFEFILLDSPPKTENSDENIEIDAPPTDTDIKPEAN